MLLLPIAIVSQLIQDLLKGFNSRTPNPPHRVAWSRDRERRGAAADGRMVPVSV